MAVSNLRRKGNTSNKLKILVRFHKIELGMRGWRLSKCLGLLTDTWLVKVVRRLEGKGIRIKANHWEIKEGRSPTIMEEVMKCDMTWEEKRKMNLCRMQKQVIL